MCREGTEKPPKRPQLPGPSLISYQDVWPRMLRSKDKQHLPKNSTLTWKVSVVLTKHPLSPRHHQKEKWSNPWIGNTHPPRWRITTCFLPGHSVRLQMQGIHLRSVNWKSLLTFVLLALSPSALSSRRTFVRQAALEAYALRERLVTRVRYGCVLRRS